MSLRSSFLLSSPVLKVTITPAGATSDVALVPALPAEADACVRSVVDQIRFPTPESAVQVSYDLAMALP